MSHNLLAKTFDEWASDGRDVSMEDGHGDVVGQVLSKITVGAGQQVLDLGCGNGWATRLIAKSSPGASAVGIDVSPKMIEQAEKLHSFTIRARYEVGRFEALDLPDGRFDKIFSMEALYYAVDLDGALREMLRVLKPGATADVVIDYYADSAATECWKDRTGVPMQRLGEAAWVERFNAAGFADVTTQRVLDSRGPGDEASFQPSCCYPDWATWRSVHDAGSLWIHALKPA